MTRHRVDARIGSRPSWVLMCALAHGCGDERPPSLGRTETEEPTSKVESDEPAPVRTNTDSSSPPPDAGPPDTGSGSSILETGAPNHCEIPTFEVPAPAVPFERLTATVVDETGEPIVDVLTQACGTNVCFQQMTDSLGRVTITEDEAIARLAFKYGDGLHYAQIVALLPPEPRHELGERATLRLPRGVATNRFEPGASLESSNVRLELAPDAAIRLDRLSYPDESNHVFVAREFERDVLPESIAEQNFAAVWVFGPQKTEFCPFASLTIPNTTTLEAGTRVDLYLLVTTLEGHFAPYAEWGKVAAATVSGDGLRIETDPGSGLPELGIVGLRNAMESASSD